MNKNKRVQSNQYNKVMRCWAYLQASACTHATPLDDGFNTFAIAVIYTKSQDIKDGENRKCSVRRKDLDGPVSIMLKVSMQM